MRGVSPRPGRSAPRRGGDRTSGPVRDRRRRPSRGAARPATPARGTPAGDRGVRHPPGPAGRSCLVEDARGARRTDGLRVARRRRPGGDGHRGQPLRAHRAAPGACRRASRLARRRRAWPTSSPPSWPRRREAASSAPACSPTTEASPSVASCGGRCRRALDGTGAAAASLAAELLSSAEEALEPVRARHRTEMEELGPRPNSAGSEPCPAARRSRIANTARSAVGGPTNCAPGSRCSPPPTATASCSLAAPDTVPAAWSGRTEERIRELAGAVTVVERSSAELVRNPNESLLLEAMLVRLSAVTG